MHEQIKQLLSAFLDNELTQAEAQRVEIHLETCEDCRKTLDDMRKLQKAAKSMEFRMPTGDELERFEKSLSVKLPRSAGWLLIIIGAAIWIGYAVYKFITQPVLDFGKLLSAAVIIGIVLLLVSVVRERLLELPHDRYRRVKR